MPYYDFRCNNCHRKFSIFLSYSEYGSEQVSCTHCQSIDVKRLINKVRFARSMESRLERLSDDSDLDSLADDPRTLGKMMREMSRETGEDLGPEFDEVVDRLEKGDDPDEIAESMPDMPDGE